MDNRISKFLFFLLLIVTTCFRVWLIEYQPLFVIGNAIHDDRLFMVLAQHILKGEWLGPYDFMTLIKGPFFPLWTALSNILNIPLLLSAQILYAVSCLVLVYAIRPLLFGKRLYAFLFFLFLLFNPASFDTGLTRATRDLIYPSLTFLVVACAFGVFFSIIENSKRVWLWGLGLGISFGCFWITREEGVWITPFLIVVAVSAVALSFRNWSKVHFWFVSKPLFAFAISSMLIINFCQLFELHPLRGLRQD